MNNIFDKAPQTPLENATLLLLMLILVGFLAFKAYQAINNK